MIDETKFRTRPFAHQLEGIRALVKYSNFALFDQMRLGKSKQVVDAACVLFEEKQIDLVVVVAPAAVRPVWASAESGEIRKHAWVPSKVSEFHRLPRSSQAGLRITWADDNGAPRLEWIVTNYEYLRDDDKRRVLKKLMRDRRAWVVLDESSFIKSHKAAQTRACLELADLAKRRTILNGTPWSHSPLDLWPQLRFLSWRILPFKNFYHFRARYALMGGWQRKQVVKFENLEELRELVRPYCLRRTLKDCFDLPEDIPMFREVALGADAWRHYQTVKQEFIAWLDQTEPTLVASSGAVKSLRLAQLASGYLGMMGEEGESLALEVSREKHDEVLAILDEYRANDEAVIVWCRFVKERERLAREVKERGWPLFQLYGAQRAKERDLAREAFRHESAPGFRVLLGQPQVGGYGLDLSAAAGVIRMSQDFNALTRWQSDARTDHAFKKRGIMRMDLLATGPEGQRTIDHTIRRVLEKREDLARWTSARWRKELEED
jgi:SNF2 family DNA or RNA helicase